MTRDTTFRAAFVGAVQRVLSSEKRLSGTTARTTKRVAEKLDAGAGITRRPLRSAL